MNAALGVEDDLEDPLSTPSIRHMTAAQRLDSVLNTLPATNIVDGRRAITLVEEPDLDSRGSDR
jgi:hypothetical protein